MPQYLWKYLLYLTSLYILCKSLQIGDFQDNVPFEEVLCKSVTIRSVKDFNQLQNCTIVRGHVRIVEMVFSPASWAEVQHSSVEEISEYLLVYHVLGLDTLERLFPKLIVIRGVELLYDEYALVVLENRDLANVGLVSLLRVLKGSIRIERNPSLCFVNTINWVWIMGNHSKQYYHDINNNKPPNQCPLCYTYRDEGKVKELNRHKKCWSHGKYQKTPLDFFDSQDCYESKESSNCLTSCSDSNCRLCTNYVSDEGCRNNCLPPKYKLAFKRECVSNCTVLGLVQLGVECVEKCPKYYRPIWIKDVLTCVLNCTGDFVIRNTKDLEGLEECSKINGSLTIELQEMDKPIVKSLERTFRNLNEITGYLKILNSPQIISLHFFENLHTIVGSQLLDNRYSLYVVNNHYLEQLWLSDVVIIHGCIYFHLNPLLCYEKITNLQKNFKDCMEITITDASTNSNGERAVCGSNIHKTNATVKDANANSAYIEVDLVSGSEFILLVGYVYFYKEAPYKNVSKYEGRHGCGKDDWFTDVTSKIQNYHVIRNLKPGTQYAFFVTSMTVKDYPYEAEHVSDVQYFETVPAKPEMVAKLYYHTINRTAIELHWWPPRVTNGILSKYLLQYEIANSTTDSTIANQTESETCQCPLLEEESTIATPHVSNYYSRERLMYRDSVMNFIYIRIDPTTTTTTTTTTTRPPRSKRADFLKGYFDTYEMQVYAKQKEGREKNMLPHPAPVCVGKPPRERIGMSNLCLPKETFDNAIEIAPDRHAYIVDNLEPEKTYRISLRACVKDLVNGCGAARVIYAQTVPMGLEKVLQNLTFHKL